jgi:formamidopyrimidine-DNA glycosylase
MALTVTLDLPPDVEQKLREETPDLNADVKEAYVRELFRRGKLSHYELSQVLGLDRFETDAYLKKHNVFEGSLTMEDLEEQRRTLDRLLGRVAGQPQVTSVDE